MKDDDRIWSPAEILHRYQSGERDFRALQIEDPPGMPQASFRGADLAEGDFTGCFILADFTMASLRGAKFTDANVKTCSFDTADLLGADFSGAAIDAATFEGADLACTHFEGASAFGYMYASGEVPGRERSST